MFFPACAVVHKCPFFANKLLGRRIERLSRRLVYIKSVHKVFIALFVEYPLCFLLCHNLRLHLLKNCGTGETALSVSCARFKSHICNSSPPPPFKTKKFLHLPLPEQYTPWYTNIQIVPTFFSSVGELNVCASVLFILMLANTLIRKTAVLYT